MQRQTRSVDPLPCKLTVEELIQKGVELCDMHTKAEQLEKEFDGIKKHYKSQIEDAEKKVLEMRDQIQTRREYRQVECSIAYDFDDKKKKVYYRNDTGEIVREVPISEHELQEELKLREEAESEKEDNAEAPEEPVVSPREE